jgi:two-component system, NarL family, response regulator NreC
MPKITILVAESQAIVRKGICILLNSYDDFQVISEAKDSIETEEKIKQLLPDIVVLDECLSGINSLESVRLIKKKVPNTKTIILAMQKDNSGYLRRLLQVQADGYVCKASSDSDLISAILAVYNNKFYLCTVFARAALEGVNHKTNSPLDNYERLTLREISVLQLVAEGYCNKEIAHRLEVSVSTIKNHKSNIMRKLKIRDSAGLIQYGYKIGIVKP